MGKEYEAKFLDIDVEALRNKIRALGGKLVHEEMKYSRVVFHRCQNVNNIKGYARIRKEGEKITMTVKVFNDPKFPDEFEVSINEDMEQV